MLPAHWPTPRPSCWNRCSNGVGMEAICRECGEVVGEDPEYGGFVHLDDGHPDRSDRGHYAEPDYAEMASRRPGSSSGSPCDHAR